MLEGAGAIQPRGTLTTIDTTVRRKFSAQRYETWVTRIRRVRDADLARPLLSERFANTGKPLSDTGQSPTG